ncbi:hypothetical protein TNCV_3813091 [Trichonephila clavipes]|nr:hypothetical protein TNCV_3813091 [Trichonephila clavipes]
MHLNSYTLHSKKEDNSTDVWVPYSFESHNEFLTYESRKNKKNDFGNGIFAITFSISNSRSCFLHRKEDLRTPNATVPISWKSHGNSSPFSRKKTYFPTLCTERKPIERRTVPHPTRAIPTTYFPTLCTERKPIERRTVPHPTRAIPTVSCFFRAATQGKRLHPSRAFFRHNFPPIGLKFKLLAPKESPWNSERLGGSSWEFQRLVFFPCGKKGSTSNTYSFSLLLAAFVEMHLNS